MAPQTVANFRGLRYLQRPLPSLSGTGGGEPDIDIIIVPELGTQISKSLVDALYAITPRAQIFEYKVSYLDETASVWASLVTSGEELLDRLLEKRGNEIGPRRRPLLFVSHGLGGIVVKRALGVLHEHFYKPGYQGLIDIEGGIIFLGSPHLTYGRQASWPRLSLLLRHTSKVSKAAALQAETEIATIANVSRKFEEAGIDVPVISAYETKEVKFSDSLFKSHRELASEPMIYNLVDKTFAETAVKNEQLIETFADHNDISHIAIGSPLFTEIHRVIQSALTRFALANIESTETVPFSARLNDDTFMSVSSRAAGEELLRPMPKSPTLSPPQATAGSTDTSSFDIIPSRSSFSEPERAVRLPCYLLRPHTQNPMFHGRQDILTQVNIALALTLEGTHRASLTSLRSFALCGLGGVGKTQIAVEYAFSRKHSYDAVFWVQASSIAKLDESFTQISVELGLEDALKAGDRVVSRNIVMSWLANPIKNINSDENAATSQDKAITWLMVFDNADDLELLHDYWPTSKNGAVLVTSRDPLAKTNLYSRGGIDLEPLSTEDSASLLRKLTGHEQVLLDEGSSLAVSKRLGGLPLAISQAAAYIQRQDLTFSEFLDMYEVESIATEFQHVKIGYHQEYQHTLSTVWSFDSLSPDAKALLDVLSFLDPDCIDEVILTQGTSISVAKFPSTSASYMNSRTTLLKSSLVKRNKEHGQLLLHRLTQDAVRLSLPKDLSQKSFAAATNLAFDFWPIPKIPFSHNVGDWTPSQKVVPHALWLQNLFLGSKDLVVDVEVKKSLAHLLQKVGWYFFERGSLAEAQPILDTAEGLCEEDVEAMEEEYAHILYCQACVACHLYQQERATRYAVKNLDQRLQMGRRDKYLGMAYLEHGVALMISDRFEEAIEAFQNSLEVYSQTPEFLSGEYRPDFPNMYLARAFCEVGRPSEAAMVVLENVRFRENKYGPNDTESKKLGLSLHTLGNARAKQGFMAEAIDAYQRAMINYKATVGNTHSSVGQVCTKLAQIYNSIGQYDSATTFISQALHVFEDRPHLEPELAYALYTKAQILKRIGNALAAEGLLGRAKALYAEVVRNGQGRQATAEEFDFDKIEPIV